MSHTYDVIYSIIKNLQIDPAILEMRKIDNIFKMVIDEYISITYKKMLLSDIIKYENIKDITNPMEQYKIIVHKNNGYILSAFKYKDIYDNKTDNDQILYVFYYKLIGKIYKIDDVSNFNKLNNYELTYINTTNNVNRLNANKYKTLTYINKDEVNTKKKIMYIAYENYRQNKIVIRLSIEYRNFNLYDEDYRHNNLDVLITIQPSIHGTIMFTYNYKSGNDRNYFYTDFGTTLYFTNDNISLIDDNDLPIEFSMFFLKNLIKPLNLQFDYSNINENHDEIDHFYDDDDI